MALPVLPVMYYDGQVGFYRFLGPLDGESLKKLKKSQKIHFSDNSNGWIWAFSDLKNVP